MNAACIVVSCLAKFGTMLIFKEYILLLTSKIQCSRKRKAFSEAFVSRSKCRRLHLEYFKYVFVCERVRERRSTSGIPWPKLLSLFAP